jgi:hypothetical protein
MLLSWLLAAPAAYLISGLPGLAAAAVAVSVVLFGALLAIVIASAFRGPSGAVYGLVLAMAARTFLPLVLGVVLHLGAPALAAAGMIYYLLVFYLAALACETVLALAKLGRPAAASGTTT